MIFILNADRDIKLNVIIYARQIVEIIFYTNVTETSCEIYISNYINFNEINPVFIPILLYFKATKIPSTYF